MCQGAVDAFSFSNLEVLTNYHQNSARLKGVQLSKTKNKISSQQDMHNSVTRDTILNQDLIS